MQVIGMLTEFYAMLGDVTRYQQYASRAAKLRWVCHEPRAATSVLSPAVHMWASSPCTLYWSADGVCLRYPR
jgi:hypothetical protein